MSVILLMIRYWREVAIGLLVAGAVAIALNIKHTYAVVDAQAAQIKGLQEDLKDAKTAVRLQADIQVLQGRIDQRTFSNISTILSRPVRRVLIPRGLLPSMY